MTKGRKAPLVGPMGYTVERLAAIEELEPEQIAAAVVNAARMPQKVRLADGRELVKQEHNGHAAYRSLDGMTVLVSDDPGPHGELRHVSISYARKLPSWFDLTVVREAFFNADVDVMIVLPRRGRYVNAHHFCLHLYQTPETWRGDMFV